MTFSRFLEGAGAGPLFRAILLGAILALLRPHEAFAENSLEYEYEDYSEPGGRIGVTTQTVRADQDLGTDMHVAVSGVVDAIAGATPSGQPAPPGSNQVVLTGEHDYRKAWESDFSRQFPGLNLQLGFSRSLEHDYVSNGWSINTLSDFNQKNTTLLLGLAGTDDNVEEFFTPGWMGKRKTEAIAGITQLIDPQTSVALNLTWGRSTGFLDDPYKVVQKDIQVLPGIYLPETFSDNRGGSRDKGVLVASLNRDVPGWHGAWEASYRFYADTFGIRANTAELSWFQHLGGNVILEPDLRLYGQTAAGFYYYNLDDTAIVPTKFPDPNGARYSSDARLSAFDEADYSLKLTWKVRDWLKLSASIGGYTQRGTDGTTPQSAYYRATVTTAGLKISW